MPITFHKEMAWLPVSIELAIRECVNKKTGRGPLIVVIIIASVVTAS